LFSILGLKGAWLDDFARGSRGEYPPAVQLGGAALFGAGGLVLEQVWAAGFAPGLFRATPFIHSLTLASFAL
jgi:hypothetical protein